MEILSYKVKGKFAHFRKYYANNTAFSFSIPPRTSIMGMIAAVMGWEKDSYYEALSSENFRIGVRVLTPLKKSFHRVNFLSIKSIGDLSKNLASDFRGEGGRIQTPFEVVSAWDISKGDVVYQIFIAPNNSGNEIYEQLKSHFLKNTPVFNVSLGTANFMASISDVQEIKNSLIREQNSDDFVLINSAIPTHLIEELKFDKEEYDNYNFVEEDMMPGDFVGNNNREVSKMNKLLFSTTPNPLRVKLSGSFYQAKLPDETINLQFIDS